MEDRVAVVSASSELRPMRLAVIAAIVTAVVALVAVFAFAPSRSLERLGVVPEFTFDKAPQGQLSRGDLIGKVWVGGFIFTSCKGICPILSKKMQTLDAKFASQSFALVSFSIDPKRDSLPVLEKFKAQWSTNPQWSYVRPQAEALADFARGLKLVVGEAGDFAHTSRLFLVDKSGWIRGYYHGTDDEQVTQLVQDIALLLSE